MTQKETFDLNNYWSDQAKMLTAMKRFQSAVVAFRNDHGIQPGGIPINERAGWYESLFTNQTFSASNLLGSRSDYELLPGNKDFINDLEYLAAEFGLESRWLMPLFIMISSGKNEIDPPSSESTVLLPRINDARLPENQQTVTRLLIEIRKDCAQSDIAKIWPKVKQIQKQMLGETPERRKQIDPSILKAYLRMREMEDDGCPHSVIAKEFGFQSSEDVSRFKTSEIEKRFRSTIPPRS
jgi:hypothetical protein